MKRHTLGPRLAAAATLLAAHAFGLPALALAPAPFQAALQPPVAPPENPTTAEKAVLGKALFWDEQLSSDGTMACGTCHQPAAGGVDPRVRVGVAPAHPGPDGVFGTADDVSGSPGVARADAFGHASPDARFGFDVQATSRQAQSMIEAAFFDELFWDGRAEGSFVDPVTGLVLIPSGGALESQSLQPIVNDVEMSDEGRSWRGVAVRLTAAQPLALASALPADLAQAAAHPGGYPGLFTDAFGDGQITPARIAFALAAYQRTLVPDQAKFDRVMRDEADFTPAENRGFNAFRSPQSRCNNCHSGSLFSDRQYHNLGLRPIAEDPGRSAVTGFPADRGRFKTPSLRNVTLRERYFHTGAPNITSLQQVMAFYNGGGGNFAQNRDPLLGIISVPPPVANDIIAFLGTLTDPRVAAEAAPFDRPTLWGERAQPNPAVAPFGAVAGTGGHVPEIVAGAPPSASNPGFRISVHGGLGGAIAYLDLDLLAAPPAGFPGFSRLIFPTPVQLSGSGPGAGHATWVGGAAATSPAFIGLTYEGRWLVRDAGAAGGTAKSGSVLVTVQ